MNEIERVINEGYMIIEHLAKTNQNPHWRKTIEDFIALSKLYKVTTDTQKYCECKPPYWKDNPNYDCCICKKPLKPLNQPEKVECFHKWELCRIPTGCISIGNVCCCKKCGEYRFNDNQPEKVEIEELNLPCFTEGYFDKKNPEEMGHLYHSIVQLENKLNELIIAFNKGVK